LLSADLQGKQKENTRASQRIGKFRRHEADQLHHYIYTVIIDG